MHDIYAETKEIFDYEADFEFKHLCRNNYEADFRSGKVSKILLGDEARVKYIVLCLI